jgi:ATP/maltotriose-dependent transcriptional regulator MalT
MNTEVAVAVDRPRPVRPADRADDDPHEFWRTMATAVLPVTDDPLTERGKTLLRYLASTLSNAEIATELYVSVNTVKTHQRTVYRKLGAAGRRDAVHRARALRLL